MKALWRRYDIDSSGTLDKEEVHHSRETAFCCFWCHFHTTNDQREAFSCSDQSGEVTTSLSLGGRSKTLTRISSSRLSKISTLASYDSFIRGNRLASYARFIGVGQLELQFIMVE